LCAGRTVSGVQTPSNYLQLTDSFLDTQPLRERSAGSIQMPVLTYLRRGNVGNLALGARQDTGVHGRRNSKSNNCKERKLHDSVGGR
jgi:hypothetical protein